MKKTGTIFCTITKTVSYSWINKDAPSLLFFNISDKYSSCTSQLLTHIKQATKTAHAEGKLLLEADPSQSTWLAPASLLKPVLKEASAFV